MNKLVAIAGICLFLGFPQLSKAQNTAFEPGKVWNDTEGNPINAHGGGASSIMKVRIIGTESTRKGKRYCPNGLRGSVTVPM